MTRLETSPVADYLIAATRELIPHIFWSRGNAPLEFSTLRMALQTHGVAAGNDNHWGILAAALLEAKVLERAGEDTAGAASRNGARNGTYRLTQNMWSYATWLAEKRGWPAAQIAVPAEQIELDAN